MILAKFEFAWEKINFVGKISKCNPDEYVGRKFVKESIRWEKIISVIKKSTYSRISVDKDIGESQQVSTILKHQFKSS